MLDPHEIPDRITVSFDDGSSTQLGILPATGTTGNDIAPVVLCLPAMGVTSGYYERLADALTDKGFHAVLLDLRGSGSSSVRASRRVSFGYAQILELELPPIVEAVRKAFDVEEIIVLGHSLGGQLGLLYAATSSHVSHAVLVASGSAWYRAMPLTRVLGRLLGLQLVFCTTLLFGHLPPWFPFAGREAGGLIRDWWTEAMTGRYRVAGSRVNYEQALADSRIPTLLVTFPSDPVVPRRCSEHLARKLTAAEVTRQEIPPERVHLPRTNHFRWALHPQAVVDAVSDWLDPEAESPDAT